jgi:hypothetical protein
MTSLFKDVEKININGGFFNVVQPQHNSEWDLVDKRRH